MLPVCRSASAILIAGALLAAALAASLLAGRLRLPGLVLFLAVGMLVGSDVIGLLDSAATSRTTKLAEAVGVIALGADPVRGRPGRRLARDPPRAAARRRPRRAGHAHHGHRHRARGRLAARELSTLEGLLIGAIISSTDGAAVFSLLRGSGLRRRLERTLEGEAGFNDPIAVLLVLGFIDWIKIPDYGLSDMLGLFAQQLGIGLVVGLAVGLARGAGVRAGAPQLARALSGRVARDAGGRVRRRGRTCAARSSSPPIWRA